jgi:hypothetical protein
MFIQAAGPGLEKSVITAGPVMSNRSNRGTSARRTKT